MYILFLCPVDNYFNGGARHKHAFDIALDKYVHNFTGGNPTILDVVRYEYTDWKNWHNSGHLEGNDMHFDRGAVSFSIKPRFRFIHHV